LWIVQQCLYGLCNALARTKLASTLPQLRLARDEITAAGQAFPLPLCSPYFANLLHAALQSAMRCYAAPQSVQKGVGLNAKLIGPQRYGQCAPIELNDMIDRHVVGLLFSGCPAAICWFVMTIAINAVNGHA